LVRRIFHIGNRGLKHFFVFRKEREAPQTLIGRRPRFQQSFREFVIVRKESRGLFTERHDDTAR
jgi:hypothetical protein